MNISKILKFLVSGIIIGAVLFFAGFGVINLLDSQQPEAEIAVQAPLSPERIVVKPPKIQVTPTQSTDVGITVVDSTNSTSSNALQGQGTTSSPIKIKPLNNSEIDGSDKARDIQTVAFGTLTLATVNAVNAEPTNANFLIENAQNVAIALVKDTSSSTLSLPVGDYKITVSQGDQKVVRFLGVKESQNGTEVFELDVPVLTGELPTPTLEGSESATVSVDAASENAPTSPSTTDAPQTDSASSEANSEAPAAPQSAATYQASVTGGLRLSALTAQGMRPIAASFDIRQLDGIQVKRFNNVKTQQLILPAGRYQVTAKTEQATQVKEVEVLATKGIHEVFLMVAQVPASTPSRTGAALQAQAQVNNAASNTATASEAGEQGTTPGQLELFAQNANDSRPLKSNFYVQKLNGTMVASKVYVESIGYKLSPGKYKVIVRSTGYKNKSVELNVRSGQTRREVFKLNASNASGGAQTSSNAVPRTNQATPTTAGAYGGLTVNIVTAATGAALPADIIITRRDGTPLKRVSGVASASFDLPPREFLIRVTYGGFTTNHQVNIIAGQLAIKTIRFNAQRR